MAQLLIFFLVAFVAVLIIGLNALVYKASNSDNAMDVLLIVAFVASTMYIIAVFVAGMWQINTEVEKNRLMENAVKHGIYKLHVSENIRDGKVISKSTNVEYF